MGTWRLVKAVTVPTGQIKRRFPPHVTQHFEQRKSIHIFSEGTNFGLIVLIAKVIVVCCHSCLLSYARDHIPGNSSYRRFFF